MAAVARAWRGAHSSISNTDEDNSWEPFLAKDADVDADDPDYCAKVRAFESRRRDEDESEDGSIANRRVRRRTAE